MLIQSHKSNVKKKMDAQKAFLILLFSLTTNDREVLDQLKPIFQQYNLHLTRFTTRIQKKFVGVFSPFSTNASFVAWTNDAISPQQLALLGQVLISKVILSASFYDGQMWPVSRFKKVHQNLASKLKTKTSANTPLWTGLQKFVF